MEGIMYIAKIHIENFRCIKSADIDVPKKAVVVGDNNSGKSTLIEAIDLVLGPDRTSRHPVINEHDFFAGKYNVENEPCEIFIEVIVVDLNEEQKRYFFNHIEWFDTKENKLVDSIPAFSTGEKMILPALRVCFKGFYNSEEDDFEGNTYFCNPLIGDKVQLDRFSKKDKRMCGFLYLRTLRTGSRALSLEHGSLLDIILSIKELRPQMWEDVIGQLKQVTVAADPEIGITEVLNSLQEEIHKYLPADTANNPVLKISDMTRESLRKIIAVFLESEITLDDGTHFSIPYYKMGTGTVNVLVLSLLSIIADLKQNVIFAMEEPEIAIPPYIQKSIVTNVLNNSQQAIFTSHSPYVLEEFSPDNVVVLSNKNGILSSKPAKLPPTVKMKTYRDDLRRKYFESLLSKRVLITEGRTEYDVYSAAARHLEDLDPDKYSSFDRMGLALVNAETDTQVAPLGEYYKNLNKSVYAVFDKQEEEMSERIRGIVNKAYEAQEHGIERVVINGVDEAALRRYSLSLVSEKRWPKHLSKTVPTKDMSYDELQKSMFDYFKGTKGDGSLAELIVSCSEAEMPAFIKETIADLKAVSG